MEEQIEEIDFEGNVIAIHPKSKLKEKMFLHKASLVFPKGKDGKFLFAKRAEDKHPFPGTWVCAIGGKVAAGETYLEAAKREMKEEGGVSFDLVEVTSFTYNEEDYKGIFTIYTTKEPTDVKTFKPDPREVQYFAEVGLSEISGEVKKNPNLFAPTVREALKVFTQNIKNIENNK